MALAVFALLRPRAAGPSSAVIAGTPRRARCTSDASDQPSASSPRRHRRPRRQPASDGDCMPTQSPRTPGSTPPTPCPVGRQHPDHRWAQLPARTTPGRSRPTAVRPIFRWTWPDGPSDELWQFDLAHVDLDRSCIRSTCRAGGAFRPYGHVGARRRPGRLERAGQVRASSTTSGRYEPAANAWTKLPLVRCCPAARYGSCASLGPDGQLWISHGFTADSGRFSDTRSYDFATGEWTDRTPQGDVPVKRCLHDCFWSSDGRLILYGGQTTGVAALGDLWSFDPSAGSWTEARIRGAAAPAVRAGARTVRRPSCSAAARSMASTSTTRGDSIRPRRHSAGSKPALAPPARSGAALIVDPRTGESSCSAARARTAYSATRGRSPEPCRPSGYRSRTTCSDQ